MPWGVAAGVVGSVAGSAISSAMAPGTSGGGGGSYYVPTGLGTADQYYQQQLQQQMAAQGGINDQLPLYQQSLYQGIGAQGYSPAYQNAANQAGTYYGQLGAALGTASNLDLNAQQSLLGAGQNVYQTALDPQKALYNRTVQQLQDQTGATNSMYGLGSSAAGAGVANQALGNFNIDWQNQQLQRQLAGLQGYGQAAGQAGQLAGQGAALGQAAGQSTLQGGALPYQTAQGIAAYPGQLASQYAQGVESGPLSSGQAINSQIIPYLNYGQGAQSVPYQSQMQGAGAAGALASQGISQLGSNPQVQNALGGFFGGNSAGGSFGGGDFSGAFTSSPYYSGGGNSYGFTM